MSFLNINTKRLLIRNLKTTDLKDFYLYRSNPEVTKYQGFDVMSLDQAANFISDQVNKPFGIPGEWVQYGLENQSTGKIIGDCAIKLSETAAKTTEIGITVSHLEQRKGYAKEALTGILQFLFHEKDIRRVVGITDTENIPSIMLLESTGFRREGHFIENIFFKGKWGSEYLYAILKREWNTPKIK